MMVFSLIFSFSRLSKRFAAHYLRDNAAIDLNIYCTVFQDVIFRFCGEFLMQIESF